LNAALNDVVDVSVTEILRGIRVQIRDAGIDIRADGGSPPRIETMTGGAARAKRSRQPSRQYYCLLGLIGKYIGGGRRPARVELSIEFCDTE
jgi:hypothetical protein